MFKKILSIALVIIVISLVGCNSKSNTQEDHNLPKGYSLDKYFVEEVTNSSCNSDSKCETPVEYLVRSNCPYTSKCINEKCTVVCPNYHSAQICPSPEDREIIKVDDKEIHCLSWLDNDLGQLLRESNIFNTSNNINSSSYSLIINNTKCHDIRIENKVVSQGEASGECGKLENAWDSSFENCGTFSYRVIISGSKKQTCLALNNEIIFSDFETSGCQWLSEEEMLR